MIDMESELILWAGGVHRIEAKLASFLWLQIHNAGILDSLFARDEEVSAWMQAGSLVASEFSF